MPDIGDSYTCAQCHETFIAGQSKEEAKVEAVEAFGDKDAPVWAAGAVTVCDDCYKEIMEALEL